MNKFNQIKEYLVEKKDDGKRLDLYVLEKYSDLSRNHIQSAIQQGCATLNKKISKPATKVKIGDQIFFDESFIAELQKSIEISAEDIPLKVIFENDDLVAIDKPPGLVVHPAHGNLTGTLVNALISRNPEILSAVDTNSAGSNQRPGIIHRLDKDTSGIILVAKNKRTLSSLTRQMAQKNVKKRYMALVFGSTPNSNIIESYIGRDKYDRKKMTETDELHGKQAITKYKTLKHYIKDGFKASFLEIEIPTGRTHQIRVHLKSSGNPIIGDQTYCTKESKKFSDLVGANRQMLHAAKIEFYLPGSTKKTSLESNLPDDFTNVLNKIS